MFTVIDSVAQIQTEVNTLLEISKDAEYENVKAVRTMLIQRMETLADCYDNHPDMEHSIKALKHLVEITAIRLESMCRIFCNTTLPRVLSRERVSNLYDEVYKTIMLEHKNLTDRQLDTWLSNLNSISKIRDGAVNHILFELDDDDIKCLEYVEAELKKLQKTSEYSYS